MTGTELCIEGASVSTKKVDDDIDCVLIDDSSTFDELETDSVDNIEVVDVSAAIEASEVEEVLGCDGLFSAGGRAGVGMRTTGSAGIGDADSGAFNFSTEGLGTGVTCNSGACGATDVEVVDKSVASLAVVVSTTISLLTDKVGEGVDLGIALIGVLISVIGVFVSEEPTEAIEVLEETLEDTELEGDGSTTEVVSDTCGLFTKVAEVVSTVVDDVELWTEVCATGSGLLAFGL
jgi:hypothetical protein